MADERPNLNVPDDDTPPPQQPPEYHVMVLLVDDQAYPWVGIAANDLDARILGAVVDEQ